MFIFQQSLSVGATSTSMSPAPLVGDTTRELTTHQPTVTAATAAALQMMTQAMAAGIAGTSTADYTSTSQINSSGDSPSPGADLSSSSPPQRNHSIPLFQNQAESSTTESNSLTFNHPSRLALDFGLNFIFSLIFFFNFALCLPLVD